MMPTVQEILSNPQATYDRLMKEDPRFKEFIENVGKLDINGIPKNKKKGE